MMRLQLKHLVAQSLSWWGKAIRGGGAADSRRPTQENRVQLPIAHVEIAALSPLSNPSIITPSTLE